MCQEKTPITLTRYVGNAASCLIKMSDILSGRKQTPDQASVSLRHAAQQSIHEAPHDVLLKLPAMPLLLLKLTLAAFKSIINRRLYNITKSTTAYSRACQSELNNVHIMAVHCLLLSKTKKLNMFRSHTKYVQPSCEPI